MITVISYLDAELKQRKLFLYQQLNRLFCIIVINRRHSQEIVGLVWFGSFLIEIIQNTDVPTEV